MTTIIGLRIPNKGIYIASDTQATSGQGKGYVTTKWVVENGWAVGVSGMVRALNLAEQYAHDLFVDLDNPYQFALHFRELLLEDGLLNPNKDNDEESSFVCKCLLAHASGLWEIGADFSIVPAQSNAMMAIGSGAHYALGADYINQRIVKDGAKRVNLAVSAACNYDIYSGGDIWSAFISEK